MPLNVVETIFSGKRRPSINLESEDLDAQSKRDFWISQSLFARNFTREEVKAVFRSNPLGCGDRWAQPRYGEKYLETIVAAAETQINDRHGSAKEKNTPFTVDSMPPGYKFGDDGSVCLITLTPGIYWEETGTQYFEINDLLGLSRLFSSYLMQIPGIDEYKLICGEKKVEMQQLDNGSIAKEVKIFPLNFFEVYCPFCRQAVVRHELLSD